MQERKQFVVTCKDCHRAVPTGAKEFPFHSIEVTCPLCGEKHRYLPSFQKHKMEKEAAQQKPVQSALPKPTEVTPCEDVNHHFV